MGYRKISNLYQSTEILQEPEVYALEKIHGTSAHIRYDQMEGKLHFFSGGATHQQFVDLFQEEELIKKIVQNRLGSLTIYGEAYGGKMQGMRETYGPSLRFVAFEVEIEGVWLDVPAAHDISSLLGIEFVHYVRLEAKLELLNSERDADSVQAKRNGCGDGKLREGIVIRPISEKLDRRGNRLLVKHKRKEFVEHKRTREVNGEKLALISDAKLIAADWVNEIRLTHVLDKLSPPAESMKDTPRVIAAMVDDIRAESEGEIVWSKEVERAIGAETVRVYKDKITVVTNG